jgi:hypothetical protein
MFSLREDKAPRPIVAFSQRSYKDDKSFGIGDEHVSDAYDGL